LDPTNSNWILLPTPLHSTVALSNLNSAFKKKRLQGAYLATPAYVADVAAPATSAGLAAAAASATCAGVAAPAASATVTHTHSLSLSRSRRLQDSSGESC